ncbi:REF/SRPP-like protein [Forsythia ovata]|uniref:REF/SRPP-like protein n=1 Tax=Forsythia ovata TaxID=205694 RepID=A0ABD1TQM6_9LAMI
MADTNPKSQPEVMESEEQRMKRLEFVQVAAFHCGPLKPGIQTVEGTVKTVVGPVYVKYHDVPVEVLKFVDRKVDESMNKVQSHVPFGSKAVAQAVVPTASYYTEKYNQTVQHSAEKGYKVASYLPLVPTEKISKVFSGDKTEPLVSTEGAVAAH